MVLDMLVLCVMRAVNSMQGNMLLHVLHTVLVIKAGHRTH